jgi:hypothetical protein
VREGECVRVGR